MTRALELVQAQPWAILPKWLRAVAAIADRRLEDVPADIRAAWDGTPAILRQRVGGTPITVDSRGNPLTNSVLLDGVAVLSIAGPLFPHANLITMFSGGTSLQLAVRELQWALANPDVRAIMLEINSPGGTVDGTAEFADLVKAAALRKPLVAFVAGMAASAAFWIATSAPRIVIGTTSILGSVGVVTVMSVQEQPDQAGERHIEIVSSNARNKRPDPREPEGRAVVVAELDALEELFLQAVAANRRTTAQHVITAFGEGGVLVGKAVVAAGMADALGTFESVLAALAQTNSTGSTAQAPAPARSASAAAIEEEPDMTLATGQGGAPAPSNPIPPAAGVSPAPATPPAAPAAPAPDPVAAERARVVAINQHTLVGHEALAAQCIADGTSAGDFALRQAAAERAAGGGHLDQLRAAEAANGARVPAAPPASPAPSPAAAATDTSDAALQAHWDANPALHAEFGGQFNLYAAWARNHKKVRVIGGTERRAS